MNQVIAGSPEEIRVVLQTLEGEHLPTRKTYIGGAVSATFLGIIIPLALGWVVWVRGPADPQSWRSIASLIAGPPLALEVVRRMVRYAVDESHITATGPLGIGSWNVMRAEIERIEASVGPLGVAVYFHTRMRKSPYLMWLRKKRGRQLMDAYPELRRMSGRQVIATAEAEQKRKRQARLMFAFLGALVVLVILVILAIEYVRR